MNEPDLDRITQRLAAALAGKRREVMAYTLLTVLSTPAFVGIASLVACPFVVHVVHSADYKIDRAAAIYGGMTLLLASAVGLTAANASRSTSRFGVDRNWLAGAGGLVLLLALTYGTHLREATPVFFGTIYAVLGFLVLGMVGRMQAGVPSWPASDERASLHEVLLAVAGFVVSAYAELFSASWLWFPPKPHEVRIAARVLCRLAAEGKGPLHECVVDDRIERLLIRLKLLRRTDNELHLTPEGLNFVRAVGENDPAARQRMESV